MTYSLIVLRSYHLPTPSWHKMANNQPTSTVFYTNHKRSEIDGEFNRYLISEPRCLHMLYLIRRALPLNCLQKVSFGRVTATKEAEGILGK